jgi:hypothetical protein
MRYPVKNRKFLKAIRLWFQNMLMVAIIIFFLGIMMSGKNPGESRMIPLTKSSLILNINVNTNVDCFTCEYESNLTDTIALENDELKNLMYFEGIHLAIPVNFIDCHNKIMNRDMQDMLKAVAHPQILVDINNFKINKINSGTSIAEVLINMDGVGKKYSIIITNYFKNNRLYFHGSFPVNLTDFYINPPSKLLGLVKVDKVIGVSFALAFNMN